MEAGTKRWYDRPTHHKDWFKTSHYVMSDIEGGKDVDIVCDLHELDKKFDANSFDFFWASSVWEHLHSPWVAAEQVLRVLKPGGAFFIQTHLVFPEHGYPHDYYRFTRMALESLFKNASCVVSCYDYECTVTPKDSVVEWNKAAPAYLNSNISGIK